MKRAPEIGARQQISTKCRERISKKQVLRPLAEKRRLDSWEKNVNFTKDNWFTAPFGKFKGRLYQEVREDAEMRSWLKIKIF